MIHTHERLACCVDPRVAKLGSMVVTQSPPVVVALEQGGSVTLVWASARVLVAGSGRESRDLPNNGQILDFAVL